MRRRPRVALLFTRVPWPLDRGDHIRNMQVLRACAARAEVTVFAFDDRGLTEVPEPLRATGARFVIIPQSRMASVLGMAAALPGRRPLQVGFFESPAMRRAISAAGRFDLGHASFLRMWPYLERMDCGRRVVDLHDSMSRRATRAATYASPGVGSLLRMEGRRMQRVESDIARTADETWIVADADRDEVLSRTPGGRIEVVPNGIELRWGDAGLGGPKRDDVLFLGNMTVSHNRDAALELARELWPRVIALHPGARLRLVGTHGREVAALRGRPGIALEGFVDDLTPLLREARLAVAPLRFATGLQNKVIETMAAGLPSVVTPVVNEGLGAPDGECLIVADGTEAFAAGIAGLLKAPDAARAMGARARAWATSRFSWDVLNRRIEHLLTS